MAAASASPTFPPIAVVSDKTIRKLLEQLQTNLVRNQVNSRVMLNYLENLENAIRNPTLVEDFKKETNDLIQQINTKTIPKIESQLNTQPFDQGKQERQTQILNWQTIQEALSKFVKDYDKQLSPPSPPPLPPPSPALSVGGLPSPAPSPAPPRRRSRAPLPVPSSAGAEQPQPGGAVSFRIPRAEVTYEPYFEKLDEGALEQYLQSVLFSRPEKPLFYAGEQTDKKKELSRCLDFTEFLEIVSDWFRRQQITSKLSEVRTLFRAKLQAAIAASQLSQGESSEQPKRRRSTKPPTPGSRRTSEAKKDDKFYKILRDATKNFFVQFGPVYTAAYVYDLCKKLLNFAAQKYNSIGYVISEGNSFTEIFYDALCKSNEMKQLYEQFDEKPVSETSAQKVFEILSDSTESYQNCRKLIEALIKSVDTSVTYLYNKVKAQTYFSQIMARFVENSLFESTSRTEEGKLTEEGKQRLENLKTKVRNYLSEPSTRSENPYEQFTVATGKPEAIGFTRFLRTILEDVLSDPTATVSVPPQFSDASTVARNLLAEQPPFAAAAAAPPSPFAFSPSILLGSPESPSGFPLPPQTVSFLPVQLGGGPGAAAPELESELRQTNQVLSQQLQQALVANQQLLQQLTATPPQLRSPQPVYSPAVSPKQQQQNPFEGVESYFAD